MNDVRILTLSKQHYLDKYSSPLKTRFTCLGYYDGIDIERVEQNTDEEIAKKRSCLSVSELWYGAGMKTQKLEGGYSNQNIGMFRYVSNERIAAEEYWRKGNDLPFLAVGFLKLRDALKFNELGREFENLSIGGDKSKEAVCQIIAYCTYDNADLIILAKANDIASLWGVFKKIEYNEEVLYLHSIIGIEEEYLKECKENNSILDVWRGTRCFIHVDVAEINLQMVSAGNENTISSVYQSLQNWNQAPWQLKGYEDIYCGYIAGHANIGITIPNSDIATLLTLLLPNGFITHQNDAYNCGLYNIESSFLLQKQRFTEETQNKSEDSVFADKEAKQNCGCEHCWCKNLIMKYRALFDQEIIRNDAGMYSYYQALIKTLNTLDQYERFALSREIFDLIYPSFKMFDEKLEKILNYMKENRNYTLLESVKTSLCEYIEYINSIVYHTIHTDQVYLMIPGYSGTSFSIPIKMNLFYQWFVGAVAEILNDNNRKFAFIITPVMETKPQTKMIEPWHVDSNRLICIKLSQRSLFFPRNLMIILTHELGHYIGKEMRCRKERLTYIFRTMTYFLVEAICPEDFQNQKDPDPKKEKICKALRESMRDMLRKKISQSLKEEIANEKWKQGYHAGDISQQICEVCRGAVSQNGSGSKTVRVMQSIPDEVFNWLDDKDEEEYVDGMRHIAYLMSRMEENRKQLLTSGVIETLVAKLIQIYREIFSDMAAIEILGCTEEDYWETFQVSEGVSYRKDKEPLEQWLRKRVIRNVCFEYKGSIENAQEEGDSPKKDRDTDKNHQPKIAVKLADDTYLYNWVETSLINYSKNCQLKMQERLKDDNVVPLVGRIRDIFSMLNDEKIPSNRFYETVIKSINEYREGIRTMYELCMREEKP